MPTLPVSAVPLAKMIVIAVQQFLSSTPFSVLVPGVWYVHTAAADAVVASAMAENRKLKRMMRNLNK